MNVIQDLSTLINLFVSYYKLVIYMFKFIKEQIDTIKKRDPAIKSTLEVFLYPSFRVQIYHSVSKVF